MAPQGGRLVPGDRLDLGAWLRLWSADSGQAASILERECSAVMSRIGKARSLGQQELQDVRTATFSAMIDRVLAGEVLPRAVALPAYVQGVAAKLASELRRNASRRREIGLVGDSVAAPDDPSTTDHHSQSVRDLRCFTRREKEVIRLVDALRSVDEVARRLGIRPQSVRTVLRTAAGRANLVHAGRRRRGPIVPEIPGHLRNSWPTLRQVVYRLGRRHCTRGSMARTTGRSESAIREQLRSIRKFAHDNGF